MVELPKASVRISFIMMPHEALGVRDRSRTGLQININDIRTIPTSSKDTTDTKRGVLMSRTMNGASSWRRRMAQKNLDRGLWRAPDMCIIKGCILRMDIHTASIPTTLMARWRAAKKKRLKLGRRGKLSAFL